MIILRSEFISVNISDLSQSRFFFFLCQLILECFFYESHLYLKYILFLFKTLCTVIVVLMT